MPDVGSTIRHRIRAARAHAPGLAGAEPDRAATFSAALQQFDELLDAASSAGAWSRPLPLFYALSQAGRAIAAAHATDWRLYGHGLQCPDSGVALLERPVRPNPGARDSFSKIAEATSSPTLTHPVQLGALWSSLPDLFMISLDDAPWRRALRVLPVPQGVPGVSLVMSQRAIADVVGVPEEFTGPGDLHAALTEFLTEYPTAEGWSVSAEGPPVRDGPQGPVLRLEWTATAPQAGEADRRTRIAEAAPEYRYADEHWLRPTVGEGRDHLSPFMTWWALLYGLSSIARYEPSSWANALNLDSSPIAVPLEVVLEEALAVVPHLVHDALYGEPLLVPRSSA